MHDITPDLKSGWHGRARLKQADGPEVDGSMDWPLGMTISAKAWHAPNAHFSLQKMRLVGQRNVI